MITNTRNWNKYVKKKVETETLILQDFFVGCLVGRFYSMFIFFRLFNAEVCHFFSVFILFQLTNDKHLFDKMGWNAVKIIQSKFLQFEKYLSRYLRIRYFKRNILYCYSSKLVWFDLVLFDGISTIVGYLMPNPFYTYVYIKYMISKHSCG